MENNPISRPPELDEFDPKKILFQTALTLGITTILALIAMVLFNDQIQTFGHWFISQFSLWGFLGFSYFTDALIVPGSIDLAFPLLAQKGFDPTPVLVILCIGSILGGTTGWFIGHFFDHIHFIQRMVDYYRAKGERLIKKFGFWAVVIAAITPVPFSSVSWIAGMMKVPFLTYFLAALFRIPRIVVMYWIITGLFNNLL